MKLNVDMHVLMAYIYQMNTLNKGDLKNKEKQKTKKITEKPLKKQKKQQFEQSKMSNYALNLTQKPLLFVIIQIACPWFWRTLNRKQHRDRLIVSSILKTDFVCFFRFRTQLQHLQEEHHQQVGQGLVQQL
jgi:ribosomal protein S4